MESKIVVAPPLNESTESGAAPSGRRASIIILSPALAALVALLLHLSLPDAQSLESDSADVGPYAILLMALLAASLVLAAIQTARRAMRPWVAHHAPLMAGAIVVLGIWDLITQKLAWMPMPFFPGPDRVFRSMIADRGFLFTSAYHSLTVLLSGYVVGVVAGVVSGVLIGWYPLVRYWGMPVVKLIGPLPAMALIPLVMMLSSDSFLPAVALIGYAVWFPVTMLTSSGIASVRLSYLDVARTLGAGPWYLIYHVAIPAALPHIFIGLFMGLLASFLSLTVAETVGVPAGLGVYLKNQQGAMTFANFYGALIIIAVICSALLTLLFKLRDWALKWQIGIIKW
jgi:NitT/TauT family transport system permease protein